MRGPSGQEQESVEITLEQTSAHKYSNMVAERRLTAMMLREVVVRSIGLEFSPSLILNLEREEINSPKESTAGDPVLPCWGSSGGPKGGAEG